MEERENEQRWEVVYANCFFQQLREVSAVALGKINHSIDMLETAPGIGHEYKPCYRAEALMFTCYHKYVPDTYWDMYYLFDQNDKKLVFFFLADTRKNPATRFADASYDDLDSFFEN
ncbi:MAG: hypothetical protein RR477_06450 [Raoultibacter sp.]